MKRCAFAMGLALIGLMATSGSLEAQWVWLGGGGSFPMSDYGEYADAGYQITAGVGIPIGENGLSVGIEGIYGQNNHSDVDGDKTNPLGVFANVGFDFGEATDPHPYVFGGVGLLQHRYSSDTFGDDSESGLGFNGGAGFVFPVGGINGWVEGRLTHASIGDPSSNTTFAGAVAGISIELGG